MKKNIGGIDRNLRILVGIALIVWAVSGGPIWAWIGVLPLFTGLIGWCPGYLPFGLSSCKSGGGCGKGGGCGCGDDKK